MWEILGLSPNTTLRRAAQAAPEGGLPGRTLTDCHTQTAVQAWVAWCAVRFNHEPPQPTGSRPAPGGEVLPSSQTRAHSLASVPFAPCRTCADSLAEHE